VIVLYILLAIIVAFFGLMLLFGIVAALVKPSSNYCNHPEQKNPMEGKRVVFVVDENEKENADGVKGHLEAVGVSDYKQTFYAKYIKRLLDIIISFGGLFVLSSVFLVIAIAIYIDDPGPIFFTQKRLGQNKQYFKLHKFRSMKMCTPARCIIGTTLKVA